MKQQIDGEYDQFEIDLSELFKDPSFSTPISVDPNAITQPARPWNPPKCECGSWVTYGEKCDNQMHADYCPIKRFHYGRRD